MGTKFMTKKISRNSGFPKKQRGMVLVIGLIMLLLMTIVGLAAIRGTGLQESMAGNMRDRNLSFQAAEAGLRVGEEFVSQNGVEQLEFNGTPSWQLPDQNKPGLIPVQNWDAARWANDGNPVDASMQLSSISAANRPRYVVEKVVVSTLSAARQDGSGVGLGSLESTEPPEYYRVTSLGIGGTGTSQSIVQTSYRKN